LRGPERRAKEGGLKNHNERESEALRMEGEKKAGGEGAKKAGGDDTAMAGCGEDHIGPLQSGAEKLTKEGLNTLGSWLSSIVSNTEATLPRTGSWTSLEEVEENAPEYSPIRSPPRRTKSDSNSDSSSVYPDDEQRAAADPQGKGGKSECEMCVFGRISRAVNRNSCFDHSRRTCIHTEHSRRNLSSYLYQKQAGVVFKDEGAPPLKKSASRRLRSKTTIQATIRSSSAKRRLDALTWFISKL
jgi:hypothetical protein